MEITRVDILLLGISIGVFLHIMAKYLERKLELKIKRDSLRLDITLGEALLKIKEELNKPKTYEGNK